MPQLGETVAEGKITKWFKSAGDVVKPGDNLFEIETDKTSMEVPSTTSGTLTEIHFQVGEWQRSALWLQDFRFGRFGNGAICGSAEGSSHGVTICASRFDAGGTGSARSSSRADGSLPRGQNPGAQLWPCATCKRNHRNPLRDGWRASVAST